MGNSAILEKIVILKNWKEAMSEKKSFKDTLHLPKTDFSIRAKAADKEPELLTRWKDEDLYNKSCNQNSEEKKFVLHDGPPFANGHMHMGHALNRTLKDITCKYKRMSGYRVVSVPGWDCHGLPIELKVTKESGESKNSPEERVAFKKKCRKYAQQWIDIQKEEIIRMGVVSDWDHPYITMSPGYEATILRCFADFVEKGFIERKGKTVPWCASCKTVLATAEIEHKDKKDPSCYILFPFDKEVFTKVFPGVASEEAGLLVWTTTPWTIPLNRAVVLNPHANYVLLQGKDNKAFVVGEKLADDICEKMEIEKTILAEFTAEKFKGLTVNHPYIEDLNVPIIVDDMVLLDDGTACVHSAPGCGPEDYFVGVKNNLEIFSPLSPDGKYTEGIQPKELEGMSVFDGQIWSIKKIAHAGKLLHKESIRHSYPHCWRCNNPLIFRATDQWFCDLQQGDLLNRAVKAAESLTFVPDWGKARLSSSIASRTEWCLSRQRQWGVPITALICKECDKAYLQPELINKVADHVEKEGIEFWDMVTLEELKKFLPKDFACECGSTNFRKEMDIVDVWFESGVGHTAVKNQHPSLTIPADVYIEGSDQHRGWFQSSLLTSMVMYDKPCTKSFVTHAYVLDAEAHKMSKSKGNVVYPHEMIKKYSADILRLWVASSDFEGNIIISETVLKNVSEVYRKIRNTCRFMISNMFDFDFEKDAVDVKDLHHLDQYALAKLKELDTKVKESYENYSFTHVFSTLNRFCTNDLSSFYLDIIKDRLYIEKKDGHLRRSAQTVMYHILDSLTRLMAPVLSFLAEEVSDFYQKSKAESIHLQNFVDVVDVWALVGKDYTKYWQILEKMRPELLKAIEAKRETGLIKHSLEAKVKIYIDTNDEQGKLLHEFIEQLQNKVRFFKDFIIVSQFDLVDSQADLNSTGLSWLFVHVDHADGVKCPRCWQWDVTKHPDELCVRCEDVLK